MTVEEPGRHPEPPPDPALHGMEWFVDQIHQHQGLIFITVTVVVIALTLIYRM